MMRRTLCMLLALALIIGLLAACGGTAQSAAPAESAGSAAADSAAPEAEETTQEAPAAEPAADVPSAVEETPDAEEPAEEVGPFGYVETPIELPIVDEPETFTIFSKVPPLMGDGLPPRSENMVQKELAERTGVKLDITEVTTFAYNDSFMLMIAGGDWTDLLCTLRTTYPGGLSAALNEEIIIDLAQYEDLMPNYSALIHSDEKTYQDCTLGGSAIGTFFGFYDEPVGWDAGLLIRADWLEKLGLDKPETIDEYHDVVTAMHNEYGAVMCLPKNGLMASQAFCSAYNVAAYFLDIGFYSTIMCYTVENDKVLNGFQQPGFKEYLKLMNQFYNEDLISHDYMSVNALSNIYLGEDSGTMAEMLNGKISLWGDTITNLEYYSGEGVSPDPDFRFEPTVMPVVEKGDTIHAGTYVCRVIEATYSISTTCRDPETLVKYMDYGYTTEGAELYNWGLEDMTFTRNPDGSHQYTDMILNNPDGYSQAQAKYVFLGSDEPFVTTLEAYHAVHNDLQMECFNVWNSNREGDCAVSYYMGTTEEEGNRISEISGDLISYLYESVAKFITGEKNLDTDYDAFLADLDTLGIEDMNTIQQAVYDRWAGISE